jgi:uncharacterized OB-fold protein
MGFEKFGLVSYVNQTRISGFIDHLEAGEIYGTKCLECGCLEFPPRAYCRRCLSDRWRWVALSGDCKLITFTRIEAAPAAFKTQAPYMLGLAEFSEGPKVFAWIDRAIPESDVKAGVRLMLKPLKLANGNFAYVLTTPSSASGRLA